MLNRRTPMKRKAFKREERPERAPVVHQPLAAPVNYAVITEQATPAPKEKPLRNEAYRRLVASFPCIHCKVPGYSQCAHANTGKGASTKVSDMDSFPLCTVHPDADGNLVQGCHEKFDQGALFSKAVRRITEPAWIADTQRKIKLMGQWPATFPQQQENEAA